MGKQAKDENEGTGGTSALSAGFAVLMAKLRSNDGLAPCPLRRRDEKEMTMNESMMKAQYVGQVLGGAQIDRNPTVGENIDAKISALKAEIARLEESKTALAPLMGMRIRDIREAMSY